jgi:hypothetical protein
MFEWKKFLTGFLPGINTAKATVQIFHILIVLGLCYCVYSTVKARFAPKQATIQTVTGGQVDASVNKKVKNSIFGIL